MKPQATATFLLAAAVLLSFGACAAAFDINYQGFNLESELIDLVILANWVVNKMQFGFSGHDSPEAPSDALLARLNIFQLDHLIEDVQRELVVTEDFCSILEG